MSKTYKLLAALFVFMLAPVALFAQEAGAEAAAAAPATGLVLSAIGAGLAIIGAAYGIGRIGGSAVESMSRQPEIAGAIQTAMIIAAALIEGIAFFALIICLLK